ncbi:putative ABC multidrug transporter [Cryphonectria parasitica EP155]|uniref:ABC multidrug transporter n=1 Tax=Cryphonectria parasitica (strain ATCC 38755 / EP155) TaxID=660469 RepID=A0A9P4XVJ4_CRYP1|nr:putative ABC multidrug transporter [Cryphonectria parasitica EP155]KAF3761592.1 putative ABC multidrug transporter [Cryphonectria parasitica EP155]
MDNWALPDGNLVKSSQHPLAALGITLHNESDAATCFDDWSFGPWVHDCSRGLDFTLLFEESILAIVPSSLSVVFAFFRIMSMRKKQSEDTVKRSALNASKQAIIFALGIVHVVILFTSLRLHGPFYHWKVASAALSILTIGPMSILSYYEHTRQPRTSLLLNAYLALSLCLGIIRARTAWLVFGSDAYTLLFTISLVFTIVIASLEVVPKKYSHTEEPQEISPEETSGLYSLALVSWLNPLIRLGNRKILDTEDLYPLHTQLSAADVSRNFSKRWQGDKGSASRRWLLTKLVRSFWYSLLVPVPSRAALLVFSICQPFFIQRLVRYLQNGPSSVALGAGADDDNTTTKPVLILASICIYGGIALSVTSFNYLNNRAFTKIRSALATAVFQKSTSLQSAHLDAAVLTLMSTDIERIDEGLRSFHEIWANTIEVTIAAWLLQQQLGPAFLAPIGGVVICALLMTWISSLAGRRIATWTSHTEGRVTLTSAVVSSMKPLKIAGLTEAAATSLQGAREQEIDAGTSYRMITVFSIVNAFSPEFLVPVATFVLAAGRRLDMAQIFASLSYLRLITAPLSQLFQRVPFMMTAFTSLNRIQEFLDREQRTDYRLFEGTSSPSSVLDGGSDGAAITLDKLRVGWMQDKWQLRDLNLTIPKSQITIITGPVASGKSTLCKTLLGEATFTQGTVMFHQQRRRVGYCDQTAFLVNGTIRSNIIGFDAFDGLLYDQVVDAVLLKADFRNLPKGDATEIGSGGATLSGGQKQRVALARALYLNTDSYILDDFTVGLDRQTADEIVRRLLRPGGFLTRRRATIVWATHSIRYLSLAQRVIALSTDGKVLHQGGPEEVLHDRQVTMKLGEDEEKQEDEDKAPAAESHEVKDDRGKDSSRALNGADIYIHYFSAFGTPLIIAAIITGLLFGFFANAGAVWLKTWAENTFAIPSPLSRINAFYLGIYAAINSLALTSLCAYVAITLVGMVRTSGSVLHRRAVTALMHAPLRYLTNTDAGVIVNYFSQDMNLVDTALPTLVMNTFVVACLLLGQAVVITIGTPPILLAYPFAAVALGAVTRFYLHTSRQLRLLELENKSPLYAQFADAVRGIVSIRAMGWVAACAAQNRQRLDDALRPLYLRQAMGIWLGLVMKLVVAAVAVAFTVLAATQGRSGGLVGAGLVALMSFGDWLNTVVQCWVQLEMSLGAVKRLKDFGEKAGKEEEERAGEDLRPDQAWPARGQIVIERVDASYAAKGYRDDAEDVSLALREVSLRFSAGEKVAIVGRTGSGKSSLILLLLRLLDPTPETENNISIDGLPLRRIHRDTLRQRIIAVPQDMVSTLAAGETFKHALDPYSQGTEEDCLAALADVGLLETVEAAGGIHAKIGREMLSQGQRQLFSLAVAVLRARLRNKNGSLGGVVLLDEITANVDKKTEKAIMRVIETIFKGYTLVAVTHSLESVAGFDRVLVMADGRVIKDGPPELSAEEP